MNGFSLILYMLIAKVCHDMIPSLLCLLFSGLSPLVLFLRNALHAAIYRNLDTQSHFSK